MRPLPPTAVFNHLTPLVLDNFYSATKRQHEDLEDFQERIPLLRVAMPRLQSLHVSSNSWCTPELITGCTSLQQVTIDNPAAAPGLEFVRDWVRAVGRPARLPSRSV